MPLRSQVYCGVGSGFSGIHWVWCNGRGPHLKWRQKPQGSSPFLIRITGSLESWDRRVRPSLVWRNGTPLASRVVLRVIGHLSSCVWNPRIFPDDARGCQGLFVLCLHPQGCLRRGVWASGFYQKWTMESGSFSMWHHSRGYVSNFLLRKASSLGAPGWAGTPSRQSRGIYPPVVIRRGESHQMKWCRELRCSPR